MQAAMKKEFVDDDDRPTKVASEEGIAAAHILEEAQTIRRRTFFPVNIHACLLANERANERRGKIQKATTQKQQRELCLSAKKKKTTTRRSEE